MGIESVVYSDAGHFEALALSEDRIQALEMEIDKHMDGPNLRCLSCPYLANMKSTLRNHIESKHVNTGGFLCSFCPKVCPTRHALKNHRFRMHVHKP